LTIPEFDRVFYTAATQSENLGDIVLAEEVVRRARPLGQLLVDDRDCPTDYCALLALAPNESVRQSNKGFKRQMLMAALRRCLGRAGRVHCLLKPGNLKGSEPGLKQWAYIGWLTVLRVLGVEISRYGSSIELSGLAAQRIERAKARNFTDYTLRDDASIALARRSGVTSVRYFPDLALGLDVASGGPRPYLCASFRNDLDTGEGHSIDEAVDRKVALIERALVAFPGTKPLLVSQVYRDDEFNRRLAERLNGEFIAFEGCATSKARLFESYQGSRLVLSNRLHVLLFGASRGALPVPVVDRVSNAKVVNVLGTLGFQALVHDVADPVSFSDYLTRIASEERDVLARLQTVFAQARTQHFAPRVGRTGGDDVQGKRS